MWLVMVLLAAEAWSGDDLARSDHQTPPPASPAAAYLQDPVAVRRGRAIFVGTCGAYCHGLQGGTRGDVPDLFDCEWKHGALDHDIFKVIAEGVPGTRMVGFGASLPKKEEDVWKVVAFMRSHSKCAAAADSSAPPPAPETTSLSGPTPAPATTAETSSPSTPSQ